MAAAVASGGSHAQPRAPPATPPSVAATLSASTANTSPSSAPSTPASAASTPPPRHNGSDTSRTPPSRMQELARRYHLSKSRVGKAGRRLVFETTVAGSKDKSDAPRRQYHVCVFTDTLLLVKEAPAKIGSSPVHHAKWIDFANFTVKNPYTDQGGAFPLLLLCRQPAVTYQLWFDDAMSRDLTEHRIDAARTGTAVTPPQTSSLATALSPLVPAVRRRKSVRPLLTARPTTSAGFRPSTAPARSSTTAAAAATAQQVSVNRSNSAASAASAGGGGSGGAAGEEETGQQEGVGGSDGATTAAAAAAATQRPPTPTRGPVPGPLQATHDARPATHAGNTAATGEEPRRPPSIPRLVHQGAGAGVQQRLQELLDSPSATLPMGLNQSYTWARTATGSGSSRRGGAVEAGSGAGGGAGAVSMDDVQVVDAEEDDEEEVADEEAEEEVEEEEEEEPQPEEVVTLVGFDEQGRFHLPARREPADSYARHRYATYKEMIDTEVSYVADLATTVEVYLLPLQQAVKEHRAIVPAATVRAMFSNAQQLLGVNQELLRRMTANPEAPLSSAIASAFTKTMPFFRMYFEYCKNYWDAVAHVKEQREHNTAFKGFLRYCAGQPRTRGEKLESFLIKPVQRICKYPLFFRELLKHMPEDHPSYKELVQARDTVQQIANEVNDKIRVTEKDYHLIEIAKVLDGCDALVVPGRHFVLEQDDVPFTDCRRRVRSYSKLFLFSDIMVLAQRTQSMLQRTARFRTVHRYDLRYVQCGMASAADGSVGQAFPVELKVASQGRDGTSSVDIYTIACTTSAQRTTLVEAIQSTADKWRETIHGLEKRRTASRSTLSGMSRYRYRAHVRPQTAGKAARGRRASVDTLAALQDRYTSRAAATAGSGRRRASTTQSAPVASSLRNGAAVGMGVLNGSPADGLLLDDSASTAAAALGADSSTVASTDGVGLQAVVAGLGAGGGAGAGAGAGAEAGASTAVVAAEVEAKAASEEPEQVTAAAADNGDDDELGDDPPWGEDDNPGEGNDESSVHSGSSNEKQAANEPPLAVSPTPTPSLAVPAVALTQPAVVVASTEPAAPPPPAHGGGMCRCM